MSVEARAHLDAALAAGERELEVRAHLLAHPELPAEEQTRLRALCRFLDAQNEQAMGRWFASRVASGFAVDAPARLPTAPPRRDVDDFEPDLWGFPEPLL